MSSLLAALEDQRAHLVRRFPVRLDARVDMALRRVEYERLYLPALAADHQVTAGEVFEILKLRFLRPGVRLRLDAADRPFDFARV